MSIVGCEGKKQRVKPLLVNLQEMGAHFKRVPRKRCRPGFSRWHRVQTTVNGVIAAEFDSGIRRIGLQGKSRDSLQVRAGRFSKRVGFVQLLEMFPNQDPSLHNLPVFLSVGSDFHLLSENTNQFRMSLLA